jgi:hypothetical protein
MRFESNSNVAFCISVAQKLEQDDDDKYLDAAWADSGSLRRSFQGLSNISWKPN